MPRKATKGQGCPICGGPKQYEGLTVDGWVEVYHGPEGHTISIQDARTGVWATYPMSEVCACCVANHSLADWTGKRFLLKKPWYDDGGALKIAGDAICAGHTREEAAKMAGMPRSTLRDRLRRRAKKYLPN